MAENTQKVKTPLAARAAVLVEIKRKAKAKARTGKVMLRSAKVNMIQDLVEHHGVVFKGQKLLSGRVPLAELFNTPLHGRVELINAGIPTRFAEGVISKSGVLGKYEVLEALELPRATYDRRIKKGDVFPASESEKILGFGVLIGQVEAMVADNPDAKDFDARAWLSKWLTTPLPALGNKKPVEYLNTMAGQNLVSTMLARMAEGVYA
jgi:putative toxin-antitoxin system antitoxin component (TIGR02293 family)